MKNDFAKAGFYVDLILQMAWASTFKYLIKVYFNEKWNQRTSISKTISKNVKWRMFSFLSELNEALNQSRLIRDDYIAFEWQKMNDFLF